LAKAVGQLVIATYKGTTPPQSLIKAVRSGHIGAVILMGGNTAGGLSSVHTATAALQAAAHAGGNYGLLIMTDQEGGEVKRLIGAPNYSAAQMSNPTLARAQGVATAKLLKRAGVNLDLAPVADVTRVNGFIKQEGRAFGSKPATVANAACAFANGLASQGVAYTLKHFPGLGSAINSTDVQPVSISESAANIHADGAAYRKCGHAPLAVVMVSSASYVHLTGGTPAVLSRKIYGQVFASDGITALPISDSFQTGAIANLRTPARNAINAGLDMVMYPGTESAALRAYSLLLADVKQGKLGSARIQAAAARVLTLKQALGLGP
jgi:beta-N-acetylhexosaminidase